MRRRSRSSTLSYFPESSDPGGQPPRRKRIQLRLHGLSLQDKFQVSRPGWSLSFPKWPVGEPAERSSDMAEKVKNDPGSIGFVEYQYAVKNSISQAAVLNPAGKFVRASLEGIGAACQAVESPRWNNFSASLTNAPGADSFPITSFTWIYLRTPSSDSARAAALTIFSIGFIGWPAVRRPGRLCGTANSVARHREKKSQSVAVISWFSLVAVKFPRFWW